MAGSRPQWRRHARRCSDVSDAAQALARMQEEAAEWAVLLGGGPIDPADQDRLNAWRARDPRHPPLLDEMLRLWAAVTPDTAEPSPGARRSAGGRSRQRRRAGAGIGLLVLLPCLFLAARQLPWQAWLAEQRTAVGEIRRITLADGSRLTLNGDTALDIDLDGPARQVRLHRGEVHVDVHKGPTPFVVIDRDGSVRALGTRYAVRRDRNDTRVVVDASRVQVQPRDALAGPVELGAGAQLRFDRHGLTQAPGAVAPSALSWQQGRLVFDDAPLNEVLRELGRHRAGLLLGTDDPALAAQRFTGVLPLAQSDQALSLLASALPLEVTRLGPWLVRVSAKAQADRTPAH